MLALLLSFGIAGAPPDAAPHTLVERERIEAAVRALPTARAALGDEAAVQGLANTEEWIIGRLKELGYEPELEAIEYSPPTHKPPRMWNNIIVELTGRESPRELVVVGAHIDAVAGSPGADDNGSGVAALLEVARVLKDRPMKRSVRMIFFNLEEIGLIGSKEHVRKFVERREAGAEQDREKIVGMFSLECMGVYRDGPNSQRSPIPEIKGVFVPPTVGDFLAVVTLSGFKEFNATVIPAMRGAAPELKLMTTDFLPVAAPDMLRSDHAPFMAIGVPAVMLTDTANFRNPNYHRPTDTADTLDYPRLTLATKAVVGAVCALAGDGTSENKEPRAEPGAR